MAFNLGFLECAFLLFEVSTRTSLSTANYTLSESLVINCNFFFSTNRKRWKQVESRAEGGFSWFQNPVLVGIQGEVLLSYSGIFTRRHLEMHTIVPLIDEYQFSLLLLHGSICWSVDDYLWWSNLFFYPISIFYPFSIFFDFDLYLLCSISLDFSPTHNPFSSFGHTMFIFFLIIISTNFISFTVNDPVFL